MPPTPRAMDDPPPPGPGPGHAPRPAQGALRPRALRPRALRPHARVALVAPAGPVHPVRVEEAAERCRALELEPVVFPAAAARHRYLAGDDASRLADLQAAFDDPGTDAVWALRGGYGTLRILHALDLSRQTRDPIPFIGFSDNTALHVRHAALGVVSFHGPHPAGEWPPEAERAFRRVLFEAEPLGHLAGEVSGPGEPTEGAAAHSTSPGALTLVPGEVEAPLVGGNLAILAAMCGTPWQPHARGKILFLEDVGEPAYRIDRMLWQLRAARVLDGVEGLAFGRFTGAPEDDACPVLDVLREYAERTGVPAVAGLPFGHVAHNVTIPVGTRAQLDAGSGTLVGLEPAVRL